MREGEGTKEIYFHSYLLLAPFTNNVLPSQQHVLSDENGKDPSAGIASVRSATGMRNLTVLRDEESDVSGRVKLVSRNSRILESCK